MRNIKSSPFWKRESFFVYSSFRTEVSTAQLMKELTAAGKRVCLPRIVGKEMLAVLYTGELVLNRFGIMEPPSGEDEPCDVVIAPLLAVDREGFRLGYGGGFYDRYFASHPSALRVGLCYEGQLTERLPREQTDMPLFAAITETGVRYF